MTEHEHNNNSTPILVCRKSRSHSLKRAIKKRQRYNNSNDVTNERHESPPRNVYPTPSDLNNIKEDLQATFYAPNNSTECFVPVAKPRLHNNENNNISSRPYDTSQGRPFNYNPTCTSTASSFTRYKKHKLIKSQKTEGELITPSVGASATVDFSSQGLQQKHMPCESSYHMDLRNTSLRRSSQPSVRKRRLTSLATKEQHRYRNNHHYKDPFLPLSTTNDAGHHNTLHSSTTTLPPSHLWTPVKRSTSTLHKPLVPLVESSPICKTDLERTYHRSAVQSCAPLLSASTPQPKQSKRYILSGSDPLTTQKTIVAPIENRKKESTGEEVVHHVGLHNVFSKSMRSATCKQRPSLNRNVLTSKDREKTFAPQVAPINGMPSQLSTLAHLNTTTQRKKKPPPTPVSSSTTCFQYLSRRRARSFGENAHLLLYLAMLQPFFSTNDELEMPYKSRYKKNRSSPDTCFSFALLLLLVGVSFGVSVLGGAIVCQPIILISNIVNLNDIKVHNPINLRNIKLDVVNSPLESSPLLSYLENRYNTDLPSDLDNGPFSTAHPKFHSAVKLRLMQDETSEKSSQYLNASLTEQEDNTKNSTPSWYADNTPTKGFLIADKESSDGLYKNIEQKDYYNHSKLETFFNDKESFLVDKSSSIESNTSMNHKNKNMYYVTSGSSKPNILINNTNADEFPTLSSKKNYKTLGYGSLLFRTKILRLTAFPTEADFCSEGCFIYAITIQGNPSASKEMITTTANINMTNYSTEKFQPIQSNLVADNLVTLLDTETTHDEGTTILSLLESKAYIIDSIGSRNRSHVVFKRVGFLQQINKQPMYYKSHVWFLGEIFLSPPHLSNASSYNQTNALDWCRNQYITLVIVFKKPIVYTFSNKISYPSVVFAPFQYPCSVSN